MLFETPDVVQRAATVLHEGGIVVTPTRTNYNIACDPENDAAIAKVFEAKRRTKYGPLILYVTAVEQVPAYTRLPAGVTMETLRRLWPSELTIILPLTHPFPPRLTMGGSTIAITCQEDSTLHRIAIAFGGPLGITSANLSGQGDIFIDLQKANEDVGGVVDLFIASDEESVAARSPSPNKSSTIVDLTFEAPYLVRRGLVEVERLRGTLPGLIEDPDAYQVRLAERIARERASSTSGRT